MPIHDAAVWPFQLVTVTFRSLFPFWSWKHPRYASATSSGPWTRRKKRQSVIFTDHVRSTREGNVFSPVCHSVHGERRSLSHDALWHVGDPHRQNIPPFLRKDQSLRRLVTKECSLPGRTSYVTPDTKNWSCLYPLPSPQHQEEYWRDRGVVGVP